MNDRRGEVRVQRDLSEDREAALVEPTVTLPVVRRREGGPGPQRLDGESTPVPENYGRANHPPANHGPRPHRLSPRKNRNTKIPAPAAPFSPAPAGAGEHPGGDLNAPPRAAGAGHVAADRARNRAVERHWSPQPSRSTAARPATRPFVRVRGRHAAMSRRQRWERRYVRSLLLADLGAGVTAGGLTFGLRFGDQVTAYNRWYLLLSAVLPVARRISSYVMMKPSEVSLSTTTSWLISAGIMMR
jgi:hypothetical protein